MPVPSQLALVTIDDGSLAVAAKVRNDFTAIQNATNAIIGFLGSGVSGSTLRYNGTDWVRTTNILLDDANSKITAGVTALTNTAPATIPLQVTGAAAQTANIFRAATNGANGYVAMLSDGTLMVTGATADLALGAGTSPGTIVMQANRFLRNVTADGTTTVRLIGTNGSDETVIGGERGALVTNLSDNTVKLPNATSFQFNATAPTITFSQLTAASSTIFASKISTDTQNQFALLGSGRQEWGPGGVTAADCILLRDTTLRMRFACDLRIDGNSGGSGIQIGTATNVKVGFYGVTPVVQPNTTGTATGFTAGAGTNVTDQSTFTGGTGPTAYRISDIVKALKNVGLMAA